MERLVNADALIEHLDRCIAESKGLMRSVCVAIKCFVQQMPTVDAVPVVHGRWVWHENRGEWQCSNCKCEPVDGFEYDNPDWPPKMSYCPNCGAKMDLEVKDA